MSKTPKKAGLTLSPEQQRAKRRSIFVGIVLGGVIGATLGLVITSFIRGCTDEDHSRYEAPVRALPPRPGATDTTK